MNIVGEKWLGSRSILHTLGAVALFGSIAAISGHTSYAAKEDDSTVKPNLITGVAGNPEWREEFAYILGTYAYTYAFPWYYFSKLRYEYIVLPSPGPFRPAFTMNEFAHFRQLMDANWKDGGNPNNDTLYSAAFVDVLEEPIILSYPDMGDRYFSFQLSGFDSDNFGYVGQRVTGSEAGNFAIVGPDWSGELPEGVELAGRSPTSMVFALGRTLVDGPEDLEAVYKIQDQYKLTPLSVWLDKDATPPTPRPPWQLYDAESDPLADWKTINRALTEVLPPESEASFYEQFKQIGIGPDMDVTAVDEATQRGLIRALDTGKKLLTGIAQGGVGTFTPTNWYITPDDWGHFGHSGNFLYRSGVQSLQGIVTNDRVEAIYPNTFIDNNGDPLSGEHRYEIQFPDGSLPPVDAFWSLTAYGMDANLIDNPIDRYAIGNRSKNLKYGEDGSLTIYLQKDSPGADKEGNWLPTGDQRFALALRLYRPQEAALSNEWQIPAVKRVD